MSRPRPILPGVTYLLSRRCTQRQFLLQPSPLTNRIALFCMARAAQKFGTLLHAFCVMGNHYHLVATDPYAKLPGFAHWLDQFIAKCVNAKYGRWEAVWSSGTYSSVRLETPETILQEMVYTLTNPVAAGLVQHGYHWPGARSRPVDIGWETEVKRPHGFFRTDGPVPDRCTLVLSRPPGFEHLTDEEFRQMLERGVEEREAELRAEALAAGRGFLGRRGVRAQSPMDRPRTRQVRRRLNPRVACRDKRRRIEMLRALKEFHRAYRDAWERFRRGEREAVFPAGTYGLRLHAGVICAAPS